VEQRMRVPGLKCFSSLSGITFGSERRQSFKVPYM